LPRKLKITKADRMVNEQMLAILEWASDHPNRWLRIGNLAATKNAAELLAKRGVIEIWPETNIYRLKPQKKLIPLGYPRTLPRLVATLAPCARSVNDAESLLSDPKSGVTASD
jgi:hypothetical protein